MEGASPAQYRKITNRVQQFNHTMRRIYKACIVDVEPEIAQNGAFQVYHQSRQAQNDIQRDRKRAQMDIQRAQLFCESTKVIAKVITSNPQPCQPPHSAHIHLSGFKESEIDMLVSSCGGSKTMKWHIVHWINSSDQNSRQISTDTFCSALEESRKSKTRLRIQLQRDGSWNKAAGTTSRIRGCAAPITSLEKWLGTREDQKKALVQQSKFTKEDKLHFALMIARSLLFLFGSPLLQDPWTTKTIYVEETDDGSPDEGLRIKPYISGQLADCLEEDSRQLERAKSFILHLGLLLWELFLGQKIEVTKEDKEGEEDNETDTLFNILNMKVIDSEIEHFHEPACPEIIGNCLTLYTKVKVIDAAFRTDLYWDIVNPLIKCLENYKPSSRDPMVAMKREATPPPRLSARLVQTFREISSHLIEYSNTGITESSCVNKKSPKLQRTMTPATAIQGPLLLHHDAPTDTGRCQTNKDE